MCGEGLERLSLAVSFRSGHSHKIHVCATGGWMVI